MRDADLKFLWSFVHRAGMYTGATADKGYAGIDVFLMAYEMGALHKCNFRTSLSNRILTKYGIPMPSAGLETQLKLVSKTTDLTWVELFKKESEALLIDVSDGEGQQRYATMLRSELTKLLDKLTETSSLNLSINWIGIKRQIEEWNGVNLSSDELKSFYEIFDFIQKNDLQSDQKIEDLPLTKIQKLSNLLKQHSVKEQS